MALVQYLFTDISNSIIICSKKIMPIPLLVFHLVQAFGTAKGFVHVITKLNKCVSFNFTRSDFLWCASWVVEELPIDIKYL